VRCFLIPCLPIDQPDLPSGNLEMSTDMSYSEEACFSLTSQPDEPHDCREFALSEVNTPSTPPTFSRVRTIAYRVREC
jgi:hypothetical protein